METNYLNDLPEFEENIESLNGSILSCIGKQYPALMILLPILMILIGILLGIASVYLKTILPITLFCVAVALAYSYFDAKARHAFMKQFARLNNYNYQQTGAIEKIDSPYLRIGYDRSISDIVAGTYQKYPIEFFNFGCTVGEGKTRRRINFTVAQINYNKPLMHIFLDARHNFFTEDSIISTEEPDTDKNCETIKLEGDFNKYFTLYAPQGYEIETLEIFTPDIMAELIDYSKNFSLEFINNNLYIYPRKVIENGKDLYALYTLVRLLVIKLAPKLETIKFEPPVQ